VDGCVWIGSETAGVCVAEGGGGIELCETLSMEQCDLAPGCDWGEEGRACEPLGCEGLAQGQCTLALECNWNPAEMICEDV
jgi:hypothetical protein